MAQSEAQEASVAEQMLKVGSLQKSRQRGSGQTAPDGGKGRPELYSESDGKSLSEF